MIAKIPTLAAQAYKHNVGLPTMYPKNNLSYVGNFMHMMWGVPAEEYEVDPIIESALNKLFILHADHEQNASTSTVRTAGSSQASPYACLSSGIASLWGPAHGGANEACMHFLAPPWRGPRRVPTAVQMAEKVSESVEAVTRAAKVEAARSCSA